MKKVKWWGWVLIGIGTGIALLILFFNNIGGIWVKYNKPFDVKPCNLEGVTSVYRLQKQGNELYRFPKPSTSNLGDLQVLGYVWDLGSAVNFADGRPFCIKGSGKNENSNYYYCNDLGYYAKIPNDPSVPGGNEFIKGKREAHNYFINLVLGPESSSSDQYDVKACFGYDNEPQS